MMRASIMRDVQREQRGRSMGVSDGREEKEARGMTPLHLGGSVQHSQSPIAAEGGAVMWRSRMSGSGHVVDIAHIGKVHGDE
jgi:hypothetical protein